MAGYDFAAQLDLYGPARRHLRQMSVQESRAYCRRLARSHEENFTVVNWLLSRYLQQHFCNLYSYCRWADDLADETGDGVAKGQLLDWWHQQLVDCYRGRVNHPVFVALAETIEEFQLPRQPFLDLLIAFRQDQTVRRYETFDDLLGYCGNSANPVGRLVLRLGRCYNDDDKVRLADSVCTGLQLANFCQDVARDYDRGRIYLPQQSCRRFGYTETMFHLREYNSQFRQLMIHEVDRAESYLSAGWPLVSCVGTELRGPVSLFISGGLAIVRAIRRANYNVWARRPTVSPWTKMRLMASACWYR